MLVVLPLLFGAIAAVGFQAHAQQSPASSSASVVKTQTSAVSEEHNAAIDKDNLQVQSGLQVQNGLQTKDGKDNGKPDSVLEKKNAEKTSGGIEIDR